METRAETYRSFEPATATPSRRPGSVRRTTTHDSLRPDGVLGAVTVVARGRDLLTDPTEQIVVLDSAALELEVEPFPDRVIVRIVGDPPHPGLQALVGRVPSAGFRQAVDNAMPGERESRSVRFQLLDDLPTAQLVSGYALQVVGAKVRQRGPMLQHPDLCAGWVAGGTIVSNLEASGNVPLHVGPNAPSVEPDDPLGWHEIDPLPLHGMRRRRRIDVWDEEDVAMVEAFFRDSHMNADGVETIVHEYTVHATVDPSTLRFRSCEAEIGELPWPECPNAAASAARLVGTPVDDLRRRVRETFVGTSTCTHLNDTLRALEDVGALLSALHAEPSSR